jgi:hypothetical protein
MQRNLLIYQGAVYREAATDGDRYKLLHFNEPSYTTTVEDLEGTLEQPETPSEVHYPDLLQTTDYMPADESWATPWWMNPSGSGQNNLQPPLYQGINFSRLTAAAPDAYLYHTTFLFYLSQIQAHGLVPGGPKNWQTFDTAGKVYFSDAGGAFTWNYKLGDLARDKSDHPVEEGWVPITLRVSREFLGDQLQEDPEGTRDGDATAYATRIKIPADQLEVWNGTAWSPIENEDEYALREQAEASAPREQDEEAELVHLDEMVFFPPALHP